MHLNFTLSKKGLKAGKFKLNYPKEIWEKFKAKEWFMDNIAYLNTAVMPLVNNEKEVVYNTSKPWIKEHIDYSILKDIPSAVEDHKENSRKKIKQFKKTKYVFLGNKEKPIFSGRFGERAVVPFGCGKDSLLTLAVCNEIGLRPVAVYVNDTVSPSENRLKLKIIKKISKQEKLKYEIVKNEIENLNDFEYWGKAEGDIGYSHLVFSFPFLSLPVLKFYNAKYIIMGNEFDLNFKFTNKDGIRCYSSFDQSFEGTLRLNKIIRRLNNKIELGSVISPLYDIAIMKILHKRYPEFGKWQSSCPGLDASNERRWCQSCSDCAGFYVYMWAIGVKPKKIGLKKKMFDKKYFKYHILFNPKEKGRYDKAEGDDEDKFAYYLAWKNGAKGYVIDKFKEKYLDEVKAKESKLYKKYFGINKDTIPEKLRKKVLSIYREELT